MVLLEHDAAVGAGTLHQLAVAVDLAAGGLEQAGDDVQEGALAAAGGADDADKLVVVDVERHAVEGYHLAVAAVELPDDIVHVHLYGRAFDVVSEISFHQFIVSCQPVSFFSRKRIIFSISMPMMPMMMT